MKRIVFTLLFVAIACMAYAVVSPSGGDGGQFIIRGRGYTPAGFNLAATPYSNCQSYWDFTLTNGIDRGPKGNRVTNDTGGGAALDMTNWFQFGGNDGLYGGSNSYAGGSGLTISYWARLQGPISDAYIGDVIDNRGAVGQPFEFDIYHIYVASFTSAYPRMAMTEAVSVNTQVFYETSLGQGQLSSNVWSHWVLAYDGITTNIYMYKNGVLASSGKASASPAVLRGGGIMTWTNILAIGNKNSKDRGFIGDIDDVGIWNYCLSAGDATNLYVYNGTNHTL